MSQLRKRHTYQPTAPVLSGAFTTSTEIGLTWTASSSRYGGISYVLERSTNRQVWVVAYSGAALEYTDPGLLSTSIYFYRLWAVDSKGATSNLSSIVVGEEWLPLAADVPDFRVGVPSDWSFASYIPVGATSFYLDPERTGFSVDSANKKLVWDGAGSEGLTSNHRLGTQSTGLADWLARANGPGVIWAHLFENEASVSNYRYSYNVGHDPNPAPGSLGSYVRYLPGGGILGNGCLELEQLTNGNLNSYWWKPFDPAVPTWQSVCNGLLKGPGEGFYLQVRVKTNCAGVGSTGGGGRKIFSVSRTENSYTWQEVVVQDTSYRGIFQMYSGRNQNGFYGSFEVYAGGADFDFQPGSTYANPALTPAYCSYQYNNAGDKTNCWTLGDNEWITYLLHVIPGDNAAPNETVEAWAWKAGMPDYVKIMERTPSSNPLTQYYDTDKSYAFNAVLLWIYETGRTAGPANQKQWYDQVILSTQPIARPTS